MLHSIYVIFALSCCLWSADGLDYAACKSHSDHYDPNDDVFCYANFGVQGDQSYSTVKSYCEQQGGQLPVIPHHTKRNDLLSAMSPSGKIYVNYVQNSAEATERLTGWSWQFPDGTQVPYIYNGTDWWPGEPTDGGGGYTAGAADVGGEQFAKLQNDGSGDIVDSDANGDGDAVCQFVEPSIGPCVIWGQYDIGGYDLGGALPLGVTDCVQRCKDTPLCEAFAALKYSDGTEWCYLKMLGAVSRFTAYNDLGRKHFAGICPKAERCGNFTTAPGIFPRADLDASRLQNKGSLSRQMCAQECLGWSKCRSFEWDSANSNCLLIDGVAPIGHSWTYETDPGRQTTKTLYKLLS